MEFVFNIYPKPDRVVQISKEIDTYSELNDKIMFKFSRYYYDNEIESHVIEVKVKTNISDIKYIMECIYMFGSFIALQINIKEKTHAAVRELINFQCVN